MVYLAGNYCDLCGGVDLVSAPPSEAVRGERGSPPAKNQRRKVRTLETEGLNFAPLRENSLSVYDSKRVRRNPLKRIVRLFSHQEDHVISGTQFLHRQRRHVNAVVGSPRNFEID